MWDGMGTWIFKVKVGQELGQEVYNERIYTVVWLTE